MTRTDAAHWLAQEIQGSTLQETLVRQASGQKRKQQSGYERIKAPSEHVLLTGSSPPRPGSEGSWKTWNLADEVGLGKTVEVGIVLSQKGPRIAARPHFPSHCRLSCPTRSNFASSNADASSSGVNCSTPRTLSTGHGKSGSEKSRSSRIDPQPCNAVGHRSC